MNDPVATTPAPSPRSRVRRTHAAALVLFLALACLQLWPLPIRLSDGLIGLGEERIPNTDVSIFLWNFWWVKKAVLDLHRSPIDCDLLGRPGPPVFVFPTLSVWNCMLSIPLSSWGSLEFSYNILVLITLALTGWCTYLLAWEATGSLIGAVLAGLLLGTLPLLVRHTGQINVFTLYWIALALVAARRFVRKPTWQAALFLGVCYLGNLLSCWYHAIDLTLMLVLFGVVAVWKARASTVRLFERKWWWAFALWLCAYAVGIQFNLYFHLIFWFSVFIYLLVTFYASRASEDFQRLIKTLTLGSVAVAVAALPVAAPMYKAMQRQAWLHDVPVAAKTVFSADAASYFMPAQWVENVFPTQWEGQPDVYGARARGASDVFPGAIGWLVILAAIAWRLWRGRRGSVWLGAAAVFVVLSLGPVLKFGGVVMTEFNPVGRLVLPAMAFHFIAVLEGIRVFLRFAFIAYLCLAVFVAIQAADLVASVADSRKRRMAVGIIGVVAALLVAERFDLPRPMARVPQTPAFQWLSAQPSGTVLFAPLLARQYENLYSQTRHEKPMVNPYVSRRPEDLDTRVQEDPVLDFLDHPLSKTPLQFLSQNPDRFWGAWYELDATWVVVARTDYRPEALESIDRVLEELLYMYSVYEDEQYRIYRRRMNPARW